MEQFQCMESHAVLFKFNHDSPPVSGAGKGGPAGNEKWVPTGNNIEAPRSKRYGESSTCKEKSIFIELLANPAASCGEGARMHVQKTA
jgi:hypothetical protein